MSCLVYGLFTTADAKCYYIGQSSVLDRRMAAHRASRFFVESRNFFATLEEGIPPGEIGVRENHWIKHFRALGHPLKNKMPGSVRITQARRFIVLNDGATFHTRAEVEEHTGGFKGDVRRSLLESLETGAPAFLVVKGHRVWVMNLARERNWNRSLDSV